MTQLSKHFSLEELTFSETATRKGLDNTPTPEIEANLAELAATLEQVRALLNGAAIHISSGYRSPKVNAAIGGSATSAHCEGLAADFTAPDAGDPVDIARAIQASTIAVDQLILEGGRWIHISIDPRMRGQVLTATFEHGKATYTQGIG